MPDLTPRQKLIDRIVKLFKLGEHTASGGQKGSTEAEMMLAVTKAREMMAKHAISMAELQSSKGIDLADQIRDRIKHHTAYTRRGTALALYDHMVAQAVGVLTDTRDYLQHGWSGGQTISMMFLGDEDDVAVASELFMIWLQQVRKMTRQLYGGGNTWNTKHTSYAVGLGMRLKKRAEEMVASLSPEQQQTFALVVQTKALIIAGEYQKLMAPPKDALEKKERKKPQRKFDQDALARGWRDGANFNMDKRIIK